MEQMKANTLSTIPLGRQGENLARQILFDVSDWEAEYGPGVAELIAQRPGDEAPYPVVTARDGDIVVWTVTSADTLYPGDSGRCELRYYVGETIAKSRIWGTYVARAMDTPSETTPPEPEQGWVDQIIAVGAAAKASADAAKASETAAKASEKVAAGSASAAKESQDAAKLSETAAYNSEKSAKESAASASASASKASASATAASESEMSAIEAKTAAETAKTEAGKSASAAKESETASKASETAAAGSASAAQQSATSAAESAAVYGDVVADVNQLKQDLVLKAPIQIMHSNNALLNARLCSGYYDTNHNESSSYVYLVFPVKAGLKYTIGQYRPSGIATPKYISKKGELLESPTYANATYDYTPDFTGDLYVTFRSDANDYVAWIDNDSSSGTYYNPAIAPLKELEEKVSLTNSILVKSGEFEFSSIEEKSNFEYALQKNEPIDLAKILKWETGGVLSDGSESTDTNYKRTGFYKLNGTILANYKGESNYIQCYCYDSNKIFVNKFTLVTSSRRNGLLNESNEYCYVKFVLYKDSNPEDSISLLLFQDALLGRQTTPKSELNSNTKYYFDSDEINMIVTINSLSDSKVIVYRNGAESTIASNVGFVDFENGKIGFYKQVGDVDATTGFEVFVQEDITFIPTIGRKYHIKSEREDGNKYTLAVTDMVTMESNTITSYAKNIGAGWGYRNYKVGTGIIVDKFNAFATQPLTPKVLVVGDSYVEGNTLWGDKDKRWCGMLKTALNGNVFINGQGGAKAYGMHEWFYKYLIDMVRPEYVIIHTYTNDSANTLYTDYMQIMINIIKGVWGATPILVKAVPNAYCTTEKATFINNWIDATDEKFFDYSSCMTVNGDGVTQDTSVYLSDLIHPNAEGHRRIYNKLICDFPELLVN